MYLRDRLRIGNRAAIKFRASQGMHVAFQLNGARIVHLRGNSRGHRVGLRMNGGVCDYSEGKASENYTHPGRSDFHGSHRLLSLDTSRSTTATSHKTRSPRPHARTPLLAHHQMQKG